MRTRIKGLVAVVMATVVIGGALAAPASATPPIKFGLRANCLAGGTPLTFSSVDTAKGIHFQLRQLRQVFCTKGTLEYTVTKL